MDDEPTAELTKTLPKVDHRGMKVDHRAILNRYVRNPALHRMFDAAL